MSITQCKKMPHSILLPQGLPPKIHFNKLHQNKHSIQSADCLKFTFSEKATKIDKIFTVDCQIDGEDFVNFCGLLRKHEL